jgi:DNA-binding MarR family transcriptional regulator
LDQKQTIAFNGLNYVAAFRGAFSEASVKERVSIEHMETFFFMMTAHNQDGVELRRLQKALGYAQAKMHRTAAVLETLGWIITQDSAVDARQKEVFLTDKGHAFFDKIANSLSENKNDSIFVKRSEDMRDVIEEDKAIRDMRVVQLPGPDPQSLKNLELLAEQIKSGKPSVDATVMVEGVAAKGEAGRAKTQAEMTTEIQEAYHRAKIDEQLQKDAALAKAKARHDKHRARLRDAIAVLEDGPIEVGANYVKTSRGIVTFAVLLRRINDYDPTLKARSIAQIGLTIATMSEQDYDKLMTPNPKTKLKRLEAELLDLKHRIEATERLGGHDGPAHIQAEMNRLAQRWHATKYELQALEAKERYQDMMSDTDEDGNDFVLGQNGTEMADGSWVYTTQGEYTEEQAQIDAAVEEPEEHNPALRRIYSRAIERNKRGKKS